MPILVSTAIVQKLCFRSSILCHLKDKGSGTIKENKYKTNKICIEYMYTYVSTFRSNKKEKSGNRTRRFVSQICGRRFTNKFGA